jgi:hypothetical protein
VLRGPAREVHALGAQGERDLHGVVGDRARTAADQDGGPRRRLELGGHAAPRVRDVVREARDRLGVDSVGDADQHRVRVGDPHDVAEEAAVVLADRQPVGRHPPDALAVPGLAAAAAAALPA